MPPPMPRPSFSRPTKRPTPAAPLHSTSCCRQTTPTARRRCAGLQSLLLLPLLPQIVGGGREEARMQCNAFPRQLGTATRSGGPCGACDSTRRLPVYDGMEAVAADATMSADPIQIQFLTILYIVQYCKDIVALIPQCHTLLTMPHHLQVQFLTTGGGRVRLNPNLYEVSCCCHCRRRCCCCCHCCCCRCCCCSW